MPVSLLLTLNIIHTFFSVNIVGFERVNVYWEAFSLQYSAFPKVRRLFKPSKDQALTIVISTPKQFSSNAKKSSQTKQNSCPEV